MTRQDLSNEATTMLVEGDEVVMERVFDAPRELVWTVLTSPEHVSAWWGPHGTTTTVVEMEVRPGGRWRWVNNFAGGEAPFTGEYLEVVPPERMVRTSAFDLGPEGPPALETLTLDEVDGGTRLRWHSRFPSPEVLGFALAQGMSKGALEQFDRIADVLVDLAPDGRSSRLQAG
ncbi:MAG TPA: SRPBCC domain-containing protein [Micromonosporaceae bacterium]|nr:SRPBCC domain-containing protein [Micromonosporaceae bacterium]